MDILALDLPSVHYEKRELILDAINQVRKIVIINQNHKDNLQFTFFLETNIALNKLSADIDNCWLHTRARKYNLSALGTYFECEGVKCTYLNFS